MKLAVFTSIAIASALLLHNVSFAYETDEQSGYVDPEQAIIHPDRNWIVPDGRRLQKFELALKTLGIPLEADYDYSQFPQAQDLSEDAIMDQLPLIDPDGGLHRYLDLQTTSISLFKDFFSNLLPSHYLEYRQGMRETGASTDSATLMSRLAQIAAQVKRGDAKPLAGLKIAIDPGHMGPAAVYDLANQKMSTWDEVTGKFVKIKNKKVSEGQLNLWTALLTAKELVNLGAEVKLTRTQDGTVATEDPSHFDAAPYLNQYYYNSLDDWMSNYLNLKNDAELVKEIVRAPEVKSIATPSDIIQKLYIAGADLEARSKLIDAYQPDIVLDIHFDASKSNALQKNRDDVEAYVPGSFRQTETGSRRVRAMALKQLLEVRRWNESVSLAGYVTESMASNLKLPLLDLPNFLSSVKVKDGVYARNLYITRRALSSLIVYLECLHYDHVNEYSKLANLDNAADFQGIHFKYPSRINSISTAIRSGLLKYFQAL